MKRRLITLIPFSVLVACGGEQLPTGDGDPGPEMPGPEVMNPEMPEMPEMPEGEPVPEPELPAGMPVLGNFRHQIDAVNIRFIGDSENKLATPRDLAFNPQAPSELWVVNRADHSVVVYDSMDVATPVSTRYWGPAGAHFLAEPSALAFGAPGKFATIHETDDFTQGPNGTPQDFMGPTLWTSDRNEFDAGHHGHMDMLHNSPNGMGIAWERDNVYWVFDGYHGAITRYDFVNDHGLGGADHSDGIIARYVEGQVRWVENVPSHMEIDQASRWLYIADTGNNRIVRLDIDSGVRADQMWPNYDGVDQYRMNDATLEVMVDGATAGLVLPSGLALHDGHIYVTDNATGTIAAFNMQGELVDWLKTGLPAGSLMGITFDANGRIYAVDALANRILEVSPRTDG